MKYKEHFIVCTEFPDEITLAFNITNCPHRCKGCHSPWLQEDIGNLLTPEIIDKLIEENHNNISCIGFFGGDSNINELNFLANYIKTKYNNSIKTGWYSGNDYIDKNIDVELFDYIKIGHYDEEKGPLNKKTTNQRLYEIHITNKTNLIDITHKFWKKDYDLQD